MSDDWDAEDFEPVLPAVKKEEGKSPWEDEDKEEEEVKESWEDAAAPAAPKTKPKKKKDDKKALEEAEKAAASEVLADPVAEKLRQQRLVEEADFKATKELFGGKKEGEKSIDDFIPKSEEEFKEFAQLVAAKVTPYSKSYHYVALLQELLRKATADLGSKETKDLGHSLSAIANEKLKKEKEAAGGKKKAGTKKQQLKVDKAEDDDFRGAGYSGGGGIDDEYDFM